MWSLITSSIVELRAGGHLAMPSRWSRARVSFAGNNFSLSLPAAPPNLWVATSGGVSSATIHRVGRSSPWWLVLPSVVPAWNLFRR